MINNDLFMTIVVMFVLSILCLLVLVGVAVWSGVEFYKSKTFKFLPIKISLIVISLLVIYLGIPFWFLGAAYNNYDSEKAEHFYDLAIKTALMPSAVSYTHLDVYKRQFFYRLVNSVIDYRETVINAFDFS